MSELSLESHHYVFPSGLPEIPVEKHEVRLRYISELSSLVNEIHTCSTCRDTMDCYLE